MFFDKSMIILIPAMIIAAIAQFKVSSTFSKYSQQRSSNGYTGSQVARMLLDSAGLYDVPIELVPGKLTDHYDPTRRIMRLSEDVFYSDSVAAIGVAAHETGHAIQHKQSYAPLNIRNSIFPVVNFSSSASWIIFMLGFFFHSGIFLKIGVLLFTAVVIFQLITLPVEFNASSRALRLLEDRGILYNNEVSSAKKVLDAAAMTYVAAALTSISELIRMVLISRREE